MAQGTDEELWVPERQEIKNTMTTQHYITPPIPYAPPPPGRLMHITYPYLTFERQRRYSSMAQEYARTMKLKCETVPGPAPRFGLVVEYRTPLP